MSIHTIRRLVLQGWERLRSKRLEYEYLQWLGFANAGMLNQGNIVCFDHAIRHLPEESTALEIGSFCGLSTNVISYLIRKHGKRTRLFTSDEWNFENVGESVTLPDSAIARAEYRQFCRESFLRNVNFFSRGQLPHAIEKRSDEFFRLWGENAEVKDVFDRDVKLGGPIDFVYVDGDHTYEATRRDFENSDRFLSRGGTIFFDDSAASAPFGCHRVVREIERDGRYRLVMRNPNYLFQKL